MLQKELQQDAFGELEIRRLCAICVQSIQSAFCVEIGSSVLIATTDTTSIIRRRFAILSG